jgi:hypothetical protein
VKDVVQTFEYYYMKMDYPNALLMLEKKQNDMDAGLWHYNMGSVLAKMNNLPLARFHLTMAESNGLHSKELIQNQLYVEEKLDVSRLEQPLDSPDYIIKAGLTAADGPLLSLGFLFLVIGLWLLKKSPTIKSALAFIIAVATPLMIDLWIESWPRKIVLMPKVIYDGPSALFGTKGELPLGLMVITNTKDEWEKIIYPSRFSGWIKSDGLKSLELK